MHIALNGETTEVTDHCTVQDLVREHLDNNAHCAVAVNDHVVPRSQHANTQLQPNDRVEIVQAVGGG